MKALGEAEEFILSGDPDKAKIGISMKSFFERLLSTRRQELMDAIEKAAREKRKKFWREKERRSG